MESGDYAKALKANEWRDPHAFERARIYMIIEELQIAKGSRQAVPFGLPSGSHVRLSPWGSPSREAVPFGLPFGLQSPSGSLRALRAHR